MQPVVGGRDPGLDTLGRLRAELRGSMTALELALAAPAPGRTGAWAERVNVALAELAVHYREHVTATEGPDGLHGAVLTTAPRLCSAVDRLVAEHAVIVGLVTDLLRRVADAAAEADAIRDLGTALLGRIARHRQQGADLIYEAYQVDLGGET